MNKEKQAKLEQIRKNKNEEKVLAEKRHKELLAALNGLHGLFGIQEAQGSEQTKALLEQIKQFGVFREEMNSIEKAIKNLPEVNDVSVNNLSELSKSISSLEIQPNEVDLTEVTQAVKDLTKAVEDQSVGPIDVKNQEASEYIPTRRVIMLNGRLVYDDNPMQVTVMGGGGGRSLASSIKAADNNEIHTVPINSDMTFANWRKFTFVVETGEATVEVNEVSHQYTENQGFTQEVSTTAKNPIRIITDGVTSVKVITIS